MPDEVFTRWLAKIDPQVETVARAKARYDSEKAKLGNIYKSAKADGFNVDADKATRVLAKQDPLDVIQNYRDTGRILRLRESPLVEQFELFPQTELPPPVNAYLAGMHAGKHGDALDNNPHTPGSEPFEQYAQGWRAGQEANQESLRGA